MRREVTKWPDAAEDLVRHGEYYVRQGSPETASRFLRAADAAFKLLAPMPEMGAPRAYPNRKLSGLRMWPIRGFPEHLIFYRPTQHGIEVVRVLHAKRDIERLLEEHDDQ